MDKLDVKKLSVEELQAELLSAETIYQDMRYNHSVAVLENTQVLKEARRNVARIKTELRSRELAQPTELQRDRIIARRKKDKKNSKK
jgi:large subunit ribosomal protein L29